MRSGHTLRAVPGTVLCAVLSILFGIHWPHATSRHCRSHLFLLLRAGEGILALPSNSCVVLSESRLLPEPQFSACGMGANSSSEDGAEV